MADLTDQEKSYLSHICEDCHVGLYDPHPEIYGWLKCEFCGYCKLAPVDKFKDHPTRTLVKI